LHFDELHDATAAHDHQVAHVVEEGVFLYVSDFQNVTAPLEPLFHPIRQRERLLALLWKTIRQHDVCTRFTLQRDGVVINLTPVSLRSTPPLHAVERGLGGEVYFIQTFLSASTSIAGVRSP